MICVEHNSVMHSISYYCANGNVFNKQPRLHSDPRWGRTGIGEILAVISSEKEVIPINFQFKLAR